MLNGEKPLSTNNSCRGWRRPKKKPKNEAFKSERSIPKTTLRRTEPYNMLKRTTKPLRRRVLTEERLAKSSKTQHLDPGGSWACLPPVYHWVWNHPATGCDMCTTHEKHTKKRETPRNANQNKTTRRAGYKKVYAPAPPVPPPKKHSELKEPDEMLSKTKTLTIIAR